MRALPAVGGVEQPEEPEELEGGVGALAVAGRFRS
jgi:hypothetical protein